jgi:hypothetical protein
MKKFDCQTMPEDVLELLFDSYRLPNNSNLVVHVDEQRQLIKDWLINGGADTNETVSISYFWVDEMPKKLFSYKDYKTEDDDDFED